MQRGCKPDDSKSWRSSKGGSDDDDGDEGGEGGGGGEGGDAEMEVEKGKEGWEVSWLWYLGGS